MLLRVILQCVKRPQNSPRPSPDRGASVRNDEVELVSRGRGSSTWTTSGRFSVNSKIHPPFEAKRRPTKRPPTPTDLGRISDETTRLHMDRMFPALWSVRHVCQCQTYDSESQCATGFVKVTSVSLACVITNKSRRFNLNHIVLSHRHWSPPQSVGLVPGGNVCDGYR